MKPLAECYKPRPLYITTHRHAPPTCTRYNFVINSPEAYMPTKTRAEKLAKELEQRRPELSAMGVVPMAREVKQADIAGMDKLAKRRAALKKLHDFKDGVL
jgi:hypothetical protein